MGPPAADSDGLEWGRGATGVAGTVTADLALVDPGGTDLGTAALAAIAGPAAPDAAEADRQASSAQSAVAGAGHTLGPVSLLGLPSAMAAPPGWAGSLITVSNASASATADAGPAESSATTQATASGTVSYWTGTGYSVLSLSTANRDVVVAPASATLGSCTVTISGSFSAGGTSMSTVPGGSGVVGADATAGSPLQGSFHVQAACGAVLLADLTVTIDLGAVQAQAGVA